MLKIFRQKYQYNPDKPIYQSDTVRTYICENIQTKNKKLIIIEHLAPAPFVEPAHGILQPIQIPTTIEPFSVYPITYCVSQIGRLNEADAMYVIKNIVQSKIKKPLYIVLSDQGICSSEVQGLLPEKTPPLGQIISSLLGLTQQFLPKQNSVVSRAGLDICQAIIRGENLSGRFVGYGWKQPKNSKDVVNDEQYIILKGRRKQEGPFDSQYGLAWHKKDNGMCKFRYINLSKTGYEPHFYKEFVQIVTYIQKLDKPYPFLKVHQYVKQSKGIKVFSEIANQGSLSQYITTKSDLGQSITQANTIGMLNTFVEAMSNFVQQFKGRGLGSLHIKAFHMHNNKLVLGDPLLVTDTVEQKLRAGKKTFDYFSPELKQTIYLQQNYKQLNKQKMDVWSFGMIVHKLLTKQIPTFDGGKKANVNKGKLSPGMATLISKCLDEYPISRPAWSEMLLKQIEKRMVKIQQVKQDESKRSEIRLGTRYEKRSEKSKTNEKKHRIIQELDDQNIDEKKIQKNSEEDKLNEKQEEDNDPRMPIPQEVATKVRRVKLILKTIFILAIYIFVFFRTFIWSSISIIQVRANYASTTLHLVDNRGQRVSSTSILTNNPSFYMNNQVTFDSIQNSYQCINNNFDPIYNPSYSLLSYIQSGGFLALLLTGWLTAIIICVTKTISIWKGGVSHRPQANQCRYWVAYGFYQLTLASLLFAHFYIYQFFYFAGATPCLSITNYKGLQPFFDSSVYLFLNNTESYFQKVFSTLGVLSIILLLSGCFYAWGPKLDQKYISSIPSILFRFIPFILLLLICRIGVFMLFGPTAINDSTKILSTLLQNSFQGFIGIIPELFVLACIVLEIVIQVFFHWCERKTAQSDRLSRLFNIKKKKTTVDGSMLQDSKIDKSNLDNSKMKLDNSSNDQF